MTALEFIAHHGLVMQSAHHPILPTLVDYLASERIKGSWWAHPKSREIYRALVEVYASPDVVATTAVDDKITLVHRELWPALARLTYDRHIPRERMGRVTQEHTAAGHHEKRVEAFPTWLPVDLKLPSTYDAVTLLGARSDALLPPPGDGGLDFPPSAGRGARARRR
jgi:hypothetical protein